MATGMSSDADTFALWRFNDPASPPVGAIRDASTHAMYRCDEATDAANLLDAGGSLDLTSQGSPAARPAGRIAGAREVVGLNQGFSRAAVAGDVTVMAGECTVEFWLKWTGGVGGAGMFFPFACCAVGGTGHLVFYIHVDSTDSATPGRVASYWNAGADATNQQFAATANGFLSVGVWTHVAVRHRLVGGSRYVDFFKNGALVTTSGALPVPSTSTSTGTMTLLAHRHSNPAALASKGFLDDMRVSSIARSDAEILSTYNAGITGGEQDYSGNARHLSLDGTAPSVGGLIDSARHVISASGGRFVLDTSAALVAWLGGGANRWTIEALVRVVGAGGGGPIVCVSKPLLQEYGCIFRAFKDFIGFGGSGGGSGFSEQTGALVLPEDEWVYLAVTGGEITTPGGLIPRHLYFYINGVLRSVTSEAVGSSSTSAAGAGSNLVVGDNYLYPSSAVFQQNGLGMDFCELRLSTRVRTPQEIADQAVAYELLGAAAANTVAPVVTAITPPSAPQDAFRLTVTDDAGTLRKVVLLARFTARGTYEVAYDGDGWGPGYETSTRAAIVDGLDFTLRRAGGWPDGEVVFKAVAIDTAGNEAS